MIIFGNMNEETEANKRRKNIEDGVNIIVAELDKKVVGFCMYRDFVKEVDKYPNADCELSALYVTSELKRNGIGSKLMLYVMDILKKQGKKNMILGCLEENYPSRAFYEKIGGKLLEYDKIEFGNKAYGLAMYEYDLSTM